MRALVSMRLAVPLLAALAGCASGPDVETLRQNVAERLAQALPEGAVTLAAFDRRGSQADTKAPAGETRRTVYFDVELKLERAFDFGAWDSPGVAGIVSALGAGPRGITGITSGGNKAGDVLRAHGTALFREDGGNWAPVAAGGYWPTEAPAYATNAPQGAAAILEAMRQVVASVPKDASPASRAVIEQELAVAHATIRARIARATKGYAIAAGPENGQYLRFAQALSGGKGLEMVPLVTYGGEENLRLLRDGKVSLALAQADAALAAYEGTGSFAAEGPHHDLRGVGSLFPEPVHVLVRVDSGLASPADLSGRRVAVGLQGSASRTTALRVLEAHGVMLEDIQPVELSLGNALVALRQKDLDAVIQTIGAPADSIRDALTEIPLRLLPLSEQAVATLAAQKAGYFDHTIPRGAYSMQEEGTRTIATAAVLLAGADLSATEVGALTRHVYEKGRDFVTRGSAQGAQVSAATARQGLTVPMHLAAAKALEDMTGDESRVGARSLDAASTARRE